MISWRRALLLLLLVAITQSGYAINVYVRIPDGDVGALKAALQGAYSRPGNTTVIVLGGTFHFGPADQLPEVRTSVSILADDEPAYFVGRDGGPANLLRVRGSGELFITNASFEGFDPVVGGDSAPAGLLVNEGSLVVQEAQFENNAAHLSCTQSACSPFKPLIFNAASGELRAVRVSVIDSGVITPESSAGSAPGAVLTNLGSARVQVSQLYLTAPGFEPAFQNSGEIWFRNVTFKSELLNRQEQREWIVSAGSLRISNSIIDGFTAGWCQNVTSTGFNLVDNPQCGIASREDIVGEPAGLRWRPVSAAWRGRDRQILTHALVPIAASSAVDSANDAWCPENSIQDFNSFQPGTRELDGDNDGVARCDRGAFEVALNVIDTGGINGLYYNPNADGHYVYIADTRFNTMVMWTTFDARGRQAWIFGIAEKAVAGRSLIADAYINRDGRVSPTGQFDPATSEHWGRLEVDLAGCNEGNFAFFTNVSGFRSGQFGIRRLAHLKRLDCVGHPAPAQTDAGNLPNGDVSALISALESAAAAGTTEPSVMTINGRYELHPAQQLPAIETDVTIRGGVSGAVLTKPGPSAGTLFLVEDGARLRLTNLEISGIEIDGALIENRGLLELERVQFSQNVGDYFCMRFGCRGGGSVIYNHESGTARLDRVSIVDSGTPSSTTFPFLGSVFRNLGMAEVISSQLYLSDPGYQFLIANQGSLRLENSTIFIRSGGYGTLFDGAPGQAEFKNAIISGFDASWCGEVESLGFNLIDDPACTFSAVGDLTGVSADLIWAPVEADWNPGGREVLVKALVPLAESVAVDSGSPDACGAGGLVSRQRNPADGDGDGVQGCDRGAVERVPSTVDKGGANGLFFNPDADGHYLFIAETTYPTMVMWTTFDAQGRQAWIFGIGDRISAAGRIVADAYINRDGKVRPDGTLKPALSEPWGTLEVQMTSCNRGRLNYQSDQPGFGSGNFDFERLAVIDQVGCVD